MIRVIRARKWRVSGSRRTGFASGSRSRPMRRESPGDLGVIPQSAASALSGLVGDGEIDRRHRRDRGVTKHDVIAFLDCLAEQAGPTARFVHQGMTSSDVLDTCLAVQLTSAPTLARRRMRCRDPPSRPEQITPPWGAATAFTPSRPPSASSWPGHYAAFDRAKRRLDRRQDEIATCAISGAVGTFANIDPAVEAHVASQARFRRSSRSRPRSSRATGTRCSSPTLGVVASSHREPGHRDPPPAALGSREAEEYFRPARRARRPCRTSAIRS